MNENVLQTLQQLVQDVIAPDVRELKVRQSALEKQSETQYKALQEQISTQGKYLQGQISSQGSHLQEQINSQGVHLQEQINALGKQSEAQYKAILAAIGQAKAQSELQTLRAITSPSERVAVLESTRH